MSRKIVSLLIILLHLSACKLSSNDENSLAEDAKKAPAAQRLSAEAQNFRNQFVNMKTEDDVYRLLLELQKNYSTYQETDMKLVAAQLIPLIPLRGVLYRLRPIIEGRAKSLHSAIVTTFMSVAIGSRIFANAGGNGGHGAWKAVNRFFNRPYPKMFSSPRFQLSGWFDRSKKTDASKVDGWTEIHQFQDFLVAVMIPQIQTAIQQVAQMSIPKDNPVFFDNQIIYGTAAFNFGQVNNPMNFQGVDEEDRYVAVTEAERRALLSSMHAAIHNIRVFSAYNLDLLPEFGHKLGFLVGIDVAGASWNVNGMSARDRKKVLCEKEIGTDCKGKFLQLFTKRSRGNILMNAAYLDLQESVKEFRIGWNILKSEGKSQFANLRLINPGILPLRNLTEKVVTNVERVINGQPIRNPITGHVLRVNSREFYNNPPQDLKQFVPVTFASGEPYEQDYKGFKNVRNYEYGMPTQWSPVAYNKYFLDSKGQPLVKTGKEIPEIVRDLTQTWGGFAVNTPLVGMSMVF